MEKLNMLIDIYEEEVVGVHSVGEKITDKEEARIISRKFGFIKWLVENEKINRWRVENNQDYAEYLGNLPLEEYGTEVLLMLLSIADEPIDYLCNLLFKFN